MGWWRNQNLERTLHDPDGISWSFLVWHGTYDGTYTQFIFFWNESKTETGLLKLIGDKTLHVSKLRDRQVKIANDPSYRKKWLYPLEFPIERHWLGV